MARELRDWSMTTRRWLIAVAIVAFGLGGYLEVERLRQTSRTLLIVAARHEREAELAWRAATLKPRRIGPVQKTLNVDIENRNQANAEFGVQFDPWARLPDDDFNRPADDASSGRSRAVAADLAARRLKIIAESEPRIVDTHLRNAAYHDALRLKYLAAARRPWRAVEPDPPLASVAGPGLSFKAGILRDAVPPRAPQASPRAE